MRTAISFWLAMAGFLHAAALTFEKELLEIHAPADASSVVADFNFKNNTDKPVTIAKVDKACSCIGVQVSDGKLVYAPGEGGKIRATFDMGNFSGVIDKTVVLYLNNDPNEKPSVTLTVQVHIPVLIAISEKEKTLKWTTGAKPEPQKIDLKVEYAKPIKIISTSCTSENYKVELKTLEAGKHYEILVTPVDTKEQGLAIIRINTDCEIKRYQVLQAFCVIRAELPPVP
ncbi:MAG: DUF1573 domain-containing protein [Verrucomicrobiota bacterium]